MRKIPKEYENPIDDLLINFADKIAPFHRDLNLTPNHLTTISLLLACTSAGLIYYDYYKIGAIVFLVSYFYDILDGHVARKYNMATQLGCWYDHFSDISKIILIGFVIFLKSEVKFYMFIMITILFGVLFSIHLGYQEKYYNSEESPSLSYLRELAPGDPEKAFRYTKHFGVGTYIIIIYLLIFTLK